MNVKPNSRFKSYKFLFDNLLKTDNVKSSSPLVTAMILADSSRTLTISKVSDKEYRIKMYNINN